MKKVFSAVCCCGLIASGVVNVWQAEQKEGFLRL